MFDGGLQRIVEFEHQLATGAYVTSFEIAEAMQLLGQEKVMQPGAKTTYTKSQPVEPKDVGMMAMQALLALYDKQAKEGLSALEEQELTRLRNLQSSYPR